MIVNVEGLSFGYGNIKILDSLGFTARPGEITTIIGANGAGKTTLLKCIADLSKHEGKVTFDGREVPKEELFTFMSYMEQNTDLDIDLNVFEIVLLGKIQSLGFYVSEEDMEEVYEVLKLMNITEFASRKIGELSGGQRQLVFIAQALVKNPSVIILDEPTSALDLYHQFNLVEFMSKITKERKCTTIMTLHHLDVACKYSDNMVIVHDHGIYAEGPPSKVFTTKMLEDVYRVRSNIVTDENGDMHLIVLGPIND
ncbi:MAG: ABC transporter ATP-binding protein [Candidatus Methanomethylophilaceae archaeon]|nr:ABC transporter ATP-binding protein [Candidatus Methanomethylophilaceae archaeon]